MPLRLFADTVVSTSFGPNEFFTVEIATSGEDSNQISYSILLGNVVNKRKSTTAVSVSAI